MMVVEGGGGGGWGSGSGNMLLKINFHTGGLLVY